MTTKEVAEQYLGIKKHTLEIWRMNGKGPAYKKVGRLIHYDMNDVIAYIESYRVPLKD